jgi:small subunit ribosomal protein S10
MTETERIRLRMETYDHRTRVSSAGEILVQTRRTNALFSGPITPPKRIKQYRVLHNPHVDKKSREQFEMRTHKHVVDVYDANARKGEALNRRSFRRGVLLRLRHRPIVSKRAGLGCSMS